MDKVISANQRMQGNKGRKGISLEEACAGPIFQFKNLSDGY